MRALRDEQRGNRCNIEGFKQQSIDKTKFILVWCSAKQAAIYKWLSRFWLAVVIIYAERWSQIYGIRSTIKNVDSWDIRETEANFAA